MNGREQMDAIGNMLDVALEYGLELEVIYHALKYMKQNPEVLPAEAFLMGVSEFVK